MAGKCTSTSAQIVHTERRKFLKTGVAGTALLLAARWTHAAPSATTPASVSAPSLKFLTRDDVIVLLSIVPVMLKGALPPDEAAHAAALDEILAGIDATIGYEPPSVRQEIRDLFNLLENSATRAVVAGIWTRWDKAPEESIRQFLASWHDSRFDLLRTAYIGLNNLIVGSWYGNPRSWSRVGYGGPPKIA